jgi:hypothetical protein
MAITSLEQKLISRYFEIIGEEQRPMAASPQVINYVLDFVTEHEVKSVLDAGSGLSSILFHHGMSAVVEVASVDDSSEWACKTIELAHEILKLKIWVKKWDDRYFDLVFYDYGSIEQRIFKFRDALKQTKRFMVIDDMHVSYYRDYVQQITQGMELRFLPETIDQYGRYSALLVK